MSNNEVLSTLSALKKALEQAPEQTHELVEVMTAVGPKQAVAIPASAFFYRVQNNRYAGNVAVDTKAIAAAVEEEAGLLIGVRPLALCETRDGHVVSTRPAPETKDVTFLEVPARWTGSTIEPQRYEHPKYGVIVESGLTGTATKEGLVAAWLSPAAVRTVAKAIVEAEAVGGFRPTLWLRVPDGTASAKAAEAGAAEAIAIDKAEAATDTDEVTA